MTFQNYSRCAIWQEVCFFGRTRPKKGTFIMPGIRCRFVIAQASNCFRLLMRKCLSEALYPGCEQLRKIVQNAYNDRPVTVCLSDLTPRPVTQQRGMSMNEHSVMER
jgi:hypothetical protein